MAAPNNRPRSVANGRGITERRRPRKLDTTGVYWRRRILAVCVVLLGVLALILAASSAQVPGAGEHALPIDPVNAGPDVVLAEVSGVYISSPIRPEDLTGLGYHPEGENLAEMTPRGRNLSRSSLLGLFASDSTPEKIQYYLMDPADRRGPQTGALDVGAEAGTPVYAPVTGTVTAIRPDPMLREGASVVEIKPTPNQERPDDIPDVRVLVSLVREIGDGIGPRSPVTAGMTELGSVADSARLLKPQLADHTFEDGNHVTVAVLRSD
jgi:hypothetical protein